MNIKNIFKKNTNLKDKTILTIKDGIIPYDKIANNDNIAFIICSKDEKVIEASIKSICNISKENKEKDITVFISSSYEKLHKLTNGTL